MILGIEICGPKGIEAIHGSWSICDHNHAASAPRAVALIIIRIAVWTEVLATDNNSPVVNENVLGVQIAISVVYALYWVIDHVPALTTSIFQFLANCMLRAIDSSDRSTFKQHSYRNATFKSRQEFLLQRVAAKCVADYSQTGFRGRNFRPQ
jgi:hypothetical protein